MSAHTRRDAKACIVFNEKAGSTEELNPLLEHCAARTGAVLRPSLRPGHLRELVRTAVADGYDRIVIAGGDGTVSEALNGIAPDFGAAEIAVLPFGTGNDFARSLGIPLDEQGLRQYLTLDAAPVRVDVVSMTGGACFANAANGGLGGSVAQAIDPDSKERWGALAYWMSALSTAMDPQIHRVRIDLDTEHLEQDIVAVAVANGRFVGGGFPVAPDALINDGLLDVTVVPPLPVIELAASGINYALNRTELATQVERYQTRRIRIQSDPPLPFSIDGEARTTADVTFEVVPGVLRAIPGPVEPALREAP